MGTMIWTVTFWLGWRVAPDVGARFVPDFAAKGHALPNVEYASVAVDVSSALNVHSNGDNSKCIDILRAHADGMAVDM